MTWWRAVRAVAGKDLQDLRREKTLLVAVAVQLFIASFSAFLLFGLQGLNDPASVDARTQAEVYYEGPGGFDEAIRSANGLFLIQDPDAADVIVRETIVDDVHEVDVTFVRDGLTTSLVVARFQVLLGDYEEALREERAHRLDTQLVQLEQVGAPAYGFAYATLLPLLAIVPVFLAGSVAGDAFSQEIQAKTLTVLRAAPVAASAIVAGKILLAVALAPAQAGLWIALLALNGFPPAHPLTLLGAVTLMGMLLSGLAILVALLLRREGATQAGYALAVLVVIALSVLLPLDPLNLLARIAAGPLDAAILATLAILGASATAAIATAAAAASWALRRGRI